MSWQRAALCWLLASVLATAYLAGAPGPSPEPPAVAHPEPAGELTPGPALLGGPLRTVEVRRGEARVALERSGETGWRVTEPAGAPIPRGLLEAFAEQLATVGSGERIDGDPADPAFGLAEPTLRVAAVGEDGRRLALDIGGRTPTGTSAYARADGAGPILVVGRSLVYFGDLLLDAARTAPSR